MPRKTKKEKIKAQSRIVSKAAEPALQDSVNREFEFSFNGLNLKKYSANKPESSYQIQQYKHVYLDLIKTAIIALGIFSLELVIYWASVLEYF